MTFDRSLLLLAKDGRRIVLLGDGNESDVFSSETVVSRFGITPDLVPAFLALTNGSRPAILAKREAIAVLGQHGDLGKAIDDPSVLLSRRIRNKLTTNGAIFLHRLKRLSPTGCCPRFDVDRESLEFDIDNDRSCRLLATHSFHSLKRFVPRPAKVHVVPDQPKRRPQDYHAIVTREDLQGLVTRLGMSECCALDAESSDKDPHAAQLFGVSLSVKKGEAFYIPTLEHDLEDADRNAVISALKRLLEGPIKAVGHNLKYDYVLLRRNGIKIANVCFDTMLAAYDYFGDSDFLSLKYLALRFLGRTISSYGDVVGENRNLLDVPFREIVDYSCEHADVALQLSAVLHQALVERGIADQYKKETLPLVETLGDWEFDGIPVDLARLSEIRDALANQVARFKDAAVSEAGVGFNFDCEKEVSAVLRMDPILAKVVGFRKITSGLLEELAIEHRVPRLLVQYRRYQKRLRDVEAVIQSVQDGRVHPIFSQTRTDYCRVFSSKPRLLDLDDASHLSSCMPPGVRQFGLDAKRALRSLADSASDNLLQSDLLGAKESCFIRNVPPLNDGDHFQLVLSVATGASDFHLCKWFLLDRTAAAAARHEIRVRYSATFRWLEQYCHETATHGFASTHGRRRYFDGLRSSNLEKKDKAMHSAVRWLIQW